MQAGQAENHRQRDRVLQRRRLGRQELEPTHDHRPDQRRQRDQVDHSPVDRRTGYVLDPEWRYPGIEKQQDDKSNPEQQQASPETAQEQGRQNERRPDDQRSRWPGGIVHQRQVPGKRVGPFAQEEARRVAKAGHRGRRVKSIDHGIDEAQPIGHHAGKADSGDPRRTVKAAPKARAVIGAVKKAVELRPLSAVAQAAT